MLADRTKWPAGATARDIHDVRQSSRNISQYLAVDDAIGFLWQRCARRLRKEVSTNKGEALVRWNGARSRNCERKRGL